MDLTGGISISIHFSNEFFGPGLIKDAPRPPSDARPKTIGLEIGQKGLDPFRFGCYGPDRHEPGSPCLEMDNPAPPLPARQPPETQVFEHWIAFWWDDHRRRSQILGPCSTTSRAEALAGMATLLQPVNAHAGEPVGRTWTLDGWIKEGFLPFIRRRWKSSTASTSGDRIRKHLIADFESVELQSVTRDLLQHYLEQKAARGLSFSVVDHLRWDLRAIFRLALQDRLLPSNPAEMLFTPRTVTRPSRRVLTPNQVQALLKVLDLREQLIVHLALFSGMRPGEILALQWKHVADDHIQVVHRTLVLRQNLVRE